MHPRPASRFALLAALGLVLAACSSSSPSASTSQSASAAPSASANTATGGTVKIGWGGSPDSLNPGDGLLEESYILYELHVGTYTSEGTFNAVIPRLDSLVELGITAVELMPVSQFPGRRNLGYDGVFPFAVQESYGGPEGLKRLVDACHLRGLAVVLDVVYNHLGPEGNYLSDFGPYFSDRYRTPWGSAVNFDGPFSDEVRRFFQENALYWLREFHVDALRLDAIHALVDS
ncbi:MAG: hypothetical protein IMZ75_06105, partial [Actinobacteria bacterium]|nr:hypothetical protein [Actinomycetota bacterium]